MTVDHTLLGIAKHSCTCYKWYNKKHAPEVPTCFPTKNWTGLQSTEVHASEDIGPDQIKARSNIQAAPLHKPVTQPQDNLVLIVQATAGM